MDSWYLLDESTAVPSPTGPFTYAQLQQMAQAGTLLPSSRVAAVGASDWMTAASDPRLGGLFGAGPMAQPVPGTAANHAGASYSFGAAWSLGFEGFKSKWTQCLVLSLIWLAISMVLAVPQWLTTAISNTMMERSGPSFGAAMLSLGGSCFGLILQVLVGLPLLAGGFYASARMHQGEFEVGNLFIGFKRYGAAVGSGALLILIYLGCALAVYVPILAMGMAGGIIGVGADSPAFLGIGLILGLLVGIVVFVLLMSRVVMRVLFAPTIVIDPAFGYPGVMDAFRLSWRSTAGIGPSMFGLLIVSGLLAMLSVLLLCVGYFLVGVPFLFSIWGATYLLALRNRAGMPLPAA